MTRAALPELYLIETTADVRWGKSEMDSDSQDVFAYLGWANAPSAPPDDAALPIPAEETRNEVWRVIDAMKQARRLRGEVEPGY